MFITKVFFRILKKQKVLWFLEVMAGNSKTLKKLKISKGYLKLKK